MADIEIGRLYVSKVCNLFICVTSIREIDLYGEGIRRYCDYFYLDDNESNCLETNLLLERYKPYEAEI